MICSNVGTEIALSVFVCLAQMVLLVVTSADLLKLTCTVIHRNNSLCLLVCVLDTFLFLWKWLHVFSCAFLSASLLLLIVFLIHIHMVSATHMSDFIAAIVLGPWRHKSISSCMQQQQLRHQRQTKATRAHRHGGDTDRLWKTQRKKIQRCARFSTLRKVDPKPQARAGESQHEAFGILFSSQAKL